MTSDATFLCLFYSVPWNSTSVCDDDVQDMFMNRCIYDKFMIHGKLCSAASLHWRRLVGLYSDMELQLTL